MAESKAELIAERIRTVLAAIVADGGATYWYTPTFVGRHAALEDRLLDPTREVLYWLIPADAPETMVERTAQHIASDLGFELFVARRRDGGGDYDPFLPPTPRRETVVNRLARDAETALLRALYDPAKLGGYCGISNVEVDLADRSPARTYTNDWDVVFLSIVVRFAYHYLEA